MKRVAAHTGLAIVVPVLLIVLWWFGSAGSTSFYFPPLQKIMQVFTKLWVFDLIPVHVVPSLEAIGIGLGVSIVLGIGIGVALGLSPFLSSMTSPVLQFLRYLPAVALLPLAIQLIGIGIWMRVTIIVLGAIWPILLNTMDGVRALNPSYRDVAKSTRIRRRDWIFRIVLPAASPQIFSGIRASLAVSVVLMVASELLGSSAGIGYFILESQRQFSIPEMWSGMVLLGIIGYLLNVIFAIIEHGVLAWHRKSRA
ncbi:ABC transporter permease [Microbacterium horticulturae]|uniref:ABC transporter permease n=1 Tax=Microbacterium horticulturae TaxID=3028316 RepID=A0ABY8BX57_9MICO|nr:ABC transporter permease [Microbacterium sp. KACC 23027]WEG08480.1 ABC transporter permease [Microbacterium sp. KACC 23027]